MRGRRGRESERSHEIEQSIATSIPSRAIKNSTIPGPIHDEGGIPLNRTDSDWGKFETTPGSLRGSVIGPSEVHLYESDDHFRNFIDCVASRGPTAAPVEVAHRSITICHLGNIAMRPGRETQGWDPRAERIAGDEEAMMMLRLGRLWGRS